MASAVQVSLTQRWQTLSPRGSAQTQQLTASSNLACIRANRASATQPLKCISLASPFRGLTSHVPSSLAFNPLRRQAPIYQQKSVSKRWVARAAAAAELEAKATPPAWEGAAILPAFISVALGLAVWKAPKPAAISQQAWQLFAIFLSTITGLVLSPLPVGAWAFLGLTVTVLTKTLTFQAAFSAFTNDVIWLIVISFFFARGFVKTGLGDRVATYFVKWLGKSTLGLSYGLTVAEALIAPAMPSTTARAGGVFLPIIKSLSLAGGSKPEDGTQKKLGAYLIQNQFQAAGNSSALFLTAAAQNLLCIKLAGELGVKVPGPWLTWFKVASVPALVALLTGPLILYKIFPPESKNTPEAPGIATKRLEVRYWEGQSAGGDFEGAAKVVKGAVYG